MTNKEYEEKVRKLTVMERSELHEVIDNNFKTGIIEGILAFLNKKFDFKVIQLGMAVKEDLYWKIAEANQLNESEKDDLKTEFLQLYLKEKFEGYKEAMNEILK